MNMQNQWGHTPLMEAVSYNNKDATAVLLSARCNVNQREYKGGETSLHISVKKNYHVITEQLLKTEEVNYVYNYQGELAIFDAVLNQKLDVVRIFVKYNYDFDKPVKLEYDGTGGKTVIRISLEKGHFETLRLLAQVGFVISYSISGPNIPKPSGPAALFADPVPSTSNSCQSQNDPDHITNIQKFLAEIQIVRSLKLMCRKRIRKELGFGVHTKVGNLPIPKCLKDFLLLNDMPLR